MDHIHNMRTHQAHNHTHTGNQEKLPGGLLHREATCKNRRQCEAEYDQGRGIVYKTLALQYGQYSLGYFKAF
ncbi:hypothetical protein D9M68_886210 [compost metagenome]